MSRLEAIKRFLRRLLSRPLPTHRQEIYDALCESEVEKRVVGRGGVYTEPAQITHSENYRKCVEKANKLCQNNT